MTFSEAFNVVKQYPECLSIFNNFRARVLKCQENGQYFAGSWQFSVDGECFYYSGDCYFDERDEKYHVSFGGGKHTAQRSRELLEDNKTWIIR